MSARTTPAALRRCVLTLALPVILAVGVLAAAAQPAAARTRTCAHRPHTLATDDGTRVWHQGSSLYSCVVYGRTAPRTKRMGTWASGSRIFIEGLELAWTVPQRIGGATYDRLWAGDMYTGTRTITNAPLVPPSGTNPPRDARLYTLIGADSTALAWVTQSGDVAMSLEVPGGQPAALGPLPTPLVASGNELLIASYAPIAAGTLAATLQLAPTNGDGDECDTESDYTVTFVDPTPVATGALWSGDAHNPGCAR